jgi:hypothetical protein
MFRRIQQGFAAVLMLACAMAAVPSSYAAGPSAQAAGASAKVDTLFSVRRDLRRCAAPACGGWWVTPVNATSGLLTETPLTAVDAPLPKPVPEYVAQFEFGCVQWSDEQISRFSSLAETGTALVSGRLTGPSPATTDAALNQYASLVVRDAFSAATATTPSGSFFSLRTSGIVCITSPCPSYQADLLNTNLSQELHDIAFAKEFSDAQLLRARSAIGASGLVVSGSHSTFNGQAGQGVRLDINQIFWPYPPVKAE